MNPLDTGHFALSAAIAMWGSLVTVSHEPTPTGWRVTVTYNSQSIVFDDERLTEDSLPRDSTAAISALWAMTAIARLHRPVDKFAEFMRTTVDDDLQAKYAEWSRVAQECVRVFDSDFGDSGKVMGNDR